MARRTREEIDRERATTWSLFASEGWALSTTCSKCGELAHCRGQRRRTVKCEICHKGRLTSA